ncbi:hypothetical protein [Alteromonas gracilis]|uniref:hypothetical protein n=1 Tax=Alteromonas gracilis TaxID=1479524 RepID=UPI0030D1EC6A
MTTKKSIKIAGIIVAILYVVMIPFAANGYGYMGYFGYYNSPSFLYWNDTHYYYEKSNRAGSVSGPNLRGGGPGRGK